MQAISNYLTILQLGVGLNLVVGAYSSYRKNQEEYIQGKIDDARENIDEILGPEVDIPAKFRSELLNEGPVKELTDKELRRYLIDVSIRFDRRKRTYGSRDVICRAAYLSNRSVDAYCSLLRKSVAKNTG